MDVCSGCPPGNGSMRASMPRLWVAFSAKMKICPGFGSCFVLFSMIRVFIRSPVHVLSMLLDVGCEIGVHIAFQKIKCPGFWVDISWKSSTGIESVFYGVHPYQKIYEVSPPLDCTYPAYYNLAYYN